jgi:hypothetical protein
MSLWQPSRKSRNAGFSASDAAQASDLHVGGEYHLLHEYLRDRFANRLVLTFAEIEDLVGFPLPEAARLQQDWWDGGPSAARSPQVDSWTLASRTATVNLSAQCVVFER